MNCEFIQYPEANGVKPCAARIVAPADVNRTSSHLILLLDISESMDDDHKLEHVKKCCHLLMDLLTAEDHVSLITFGDTSEILVNNLSVDSSQKEHIRAILSSLVTRGCTNLSAGLANVGAVLQQDTTQQKAGLLLLTDGIANMGIRSQDGLLTLTTKLRSDYPHMSVYTIGYGTDHNADLLRCLAEESSGSYAIVQSIEDTATAFGDILGGLTSLVAQTTTLRVPSGTRVHGPYAVKPIGDGHGISVGDVYAGTRPIVLFDIPVGSPTGDVSLSGMTSDGTSFAIPATWVQHTQREPEIELCWLRYVCSEILKSLRKWSMMNQDQQRALVERIDAFEKDVSADALSGFPVATSLRAEVAVLRETLERARSHGHMTNEEASLLSQHSAVLSMGRGFTSPIGRRYTTPLGNQAHLQNPHSHDLETQTEDEPSNVHFQSAAQARISNLLRSASQQPQ